MLKLILLLYLSSVSIALDELEVEVEEGTLKGIKLRTLIGHSVHAYLGVPFAKPPVGDLRFKNPKPADKWEDVRDAKIMPDYCVQHNVGLKLIDKEPLVGSEDCLYLNIYKPAVFEHGKLPVLVYIHGGDFVYGGAKDYNHKNIIDYNVLLVVIQYRVGALGFLSTDESPLSGNYGLKDQQFALKWIQKNIASFNGDPKRVTLMGDGAGAASVHYHILSGGSNGLFHRAVLLSGNALCPWASGNNHRRFAADIGIYFNCNLETGSQKYKECMQKIDAHEIVKYHADSMAFPTGSNAMLPRVDGSFLINFPEVLQKYKLYNNVDVIIGRTKDEGASFLVGLQEPLVKELDFENISRYLMIKEEGDEEKRHQLVSTLMTKYQGNEQFEDYEEMMVQILSDRHFNFAHHVAVQYFANNNKIKTFLFEVTHKTTSPNKDLYSSLPTKYISQSEILRLIFNGGGIYPLEFVDGNDMFVTNIILTALTTFTRHGNPTSVTLYGSEWHQAKQMNSQALNTKYIHHPAEELEIESCNTDEFLKFWYSLPLKQTKLLRSDNERKIQKMYYEDSDQDNVCYLKEAENEEATCIQQIQSSIKLENWIENDGYLQEYEWIKENNWMEKR